MSFQAEGHFTEKKKKKRSDESLFSVGFCFSSGQRLTLKATFLLLLQGRKPSKMTKSCKIYRWGPLWPCTSEILVLRSAGRWWAKVDYVLKKRCCKKMRAYKCIFVLSPLPSPGFLCGMRRVSAQLPALLFQSSVRVLAEICLGLQSPSSCHVGGKNVHIAFGESGELAVGRVLPFCFIRKRIAATSPFHSGNAGFFTSVWTRQEITTRNLARIARCLWSWSYVKLVTLSILKCCLSIGYNVKIIKQISDCFTS